MAEGRGPGGYGRRGSIALWGETTACLDWNTEASDSQWRSLPRCM